MRAASPSPQETVLTIRREQVAVFGTADREGFAAQVLPHLAEAHPAWFARHGADAAQRFVDRALDKGIGHGIAGRQAALTFVELLIEFGESFERSPEQAWAQGILGHRTLPGVLKVKVLAERLRALTKGRTIVELGS